MPVCKVLIIDEVLYDMFCCCVWRWIDFGRTWIGRKISFSCLRRISVQMLVTVLLLIIKTKINNNNDSPSFTSAYIEPHHFISVRSMSSPSVRLSVCLSSVTFMRPGVEAPCVAASRVQTLVSISLATVPSLSLPRVSGTVCLPMSHRPRRC